MPVVAVKVLWLVLLLELLVMGPHLKRRRINHRHTQQATSDAQAPQSWHIRSTRCSKAFKVGTSAMSDHPATHGDQDYIKGSIPLVCMPVGRAELTWYVVRSSFGSVSELLVISAS